MQKTISILGILVLISGCSATTGGITEEQKQAGIGGGIGAVVGAAVGAVVGGATGSDKKGRDALIGATAGAALGVLISKRMNKQQEELSQVEGVEQVSYDQELQTIDATLRVLFDYDKAEIKATEAVKLDELANVFANYPENIVTLEGHTDSDGKEDYNQSLSEQRAGAIETYLRGKNINISQLSSVGYGETRPIASNETAEGKAQNRRVEIKIAVDASRVPQETAPQTQPVNTTPAPASQI